MRDALEPAVQRLIERSHVNPAVGEEEIEAARSELSALSDGLNGVRVRLAGLRLLLVSSA